LKQWYRPILAFFLPLFLALWVPVPSIPKKLDLLGMIRHIDSNNTHLGAVNEQIVDNLAGVSKLADTTSRISSNLHELKDGLTNQNQYLSHLDSYSKQEVDLSSSLHQLADRLVHDLNNVRQSAANQDRDVKQLLTTTNSLKQLAAQVEQTNGVIAGKLSKANTQSQQVANSMP
jgi:uncharacterized phage infection (PIP) family protein YhgE